VYAGNLPGRVDEYENTHCPHCKRVLIKRQGYVLRDYRLTERGACPYCHTPVAGIWPENPKEVNLDGPGIPMQLF